MTEGRTRAAAAADIGAVLQLWDEGRAAHASTADTPEALGRLLTYAPGALIVAEDAGGAVVGVVVAGWDGWRAQLHRLSVAPAARRTGVGRALVAAAEAWLRAQGSPSASVLVAADDPRARGFWAAVGYPHDPDHFRAVKRF